MERGALLAQMTGSGSAVFAVYRSIADFAALAALGEPVMRCKPAERGVVKVLS
jgi:4-diphosphocytidyl-2C-methyl-D-erythritol kinase